jgi:thiol:disulfide interchange protein DsbG
LKLTHLASTRLAFPLAISLALAMGLVACSKTDAPGAAAPAAPTQPAAAIAPDQAFSAAAAQGKGFTVGAIMSAHTVYVLFDPQCPHCGHLWEAAKPLQSKAKFVWMPVAIMNAKSGPQGAALLQAGNPSEVMSAHEKSILEGTGGMAASASAPAEIEQSIKANTALFNSLKVDSVPFIIAKHAKTGQVVTHAGAMNTAALTAFLGVDPQ